MVADVTGKNLSRNWPQVAETTVTGLIRRDWHT